MLSVSPDQAAANAEVPDEQAGIETLVRAAQAGDVEAFGQLFDLLHESVYRYIFSRVGRACDAEDLTQVVFMKALVALPRFELRGVPFHGWLLRLARNAVVDFARSQPRHAELEEACADSRDLGPEPEAVALRRAEAEEIRAALDTLGGDQREVVSLRFFGGLSTRETALAIHRDEAAVRVMQFRALGRLRRVLDAQSSRQLGQVAFMRVEGDLT